MRNPKAPLPPRRSQPDGYEVASRPPPSGGSGVREQIEPEGFFDDPQDETRPALADEAKKALDLAAQRRKSLQPILDRDAETAAMTPNEYQKALERLKVQRAGVPASTPPAPATTRDKTKDDRSDPALALAQLTAQRATGASAPPPPMNHTAQMLAAPVQRPSLPSAPPPNRPLSLDSASAIPSARDLAANVARRSMVDAKPSSSPSVTPPPPPVATDDPDIIKSLLGGVVPGPRQGGPGGPDALSGNTVPLNVNQLMRPPTGPALSPQRTPLPIAVGGAKSGLMVQTDRPGSMPPAGFGGFPKSQPPGPGPMRPQMPSRPPGALGPGPAAPKQYDFKRWSSPEISEMPHDGSPVTFQVYTAQDVAQGRGPMRSLPVIEAPQKSAGSIAMKVGLALLGGVIVLITAAAVIMVSTDEPKKAPAPPGPPSQSAAPPVTLAPEVAPTVLVIPGDAPAPEEPAVAPTTKKPNPRTPTGGGGGGGAVVQPSSGKGPVTPPPNPYGKP